MQTLLRRFQAGCLLCCILEPLEPFEPWCRWQGIGSNAKVFLFHTERLVSSWIPNHDKHIVHKTAGFNQFFGTFGCRSKNLLPGKSKPEWRISAWSQVCWFSALYTLDCVGFQYKFQLLRTLDPCTFRTLWPFPIPQPTPAHPKHRTFRQWSASFLKSSYQSSERSTMPI